MPAAPRPIPLGLNSYLDQQKRAEAAYPVPTIIRKVKVRVEDPVDLWIRGGGGVAATGTVPNTPPVSTDTKYRGIKIPKVAGSEGGFWGLTFGFAGFVLMAALVLWWFLRRCRQNRRAGGPQGSNTSASSTHNSFTSLASLFRRPFSRRSNPPPPADASATASKRGWLHNSSRDWDQIDDDEADLVSPSGGGRGRPGESMELYNAVSRSNPDPVGSRERRESRSPRPDQQSFGRGTHPYGQGGHEASVNSLNFASTSTVRLSAPEQGGGGEDGGGGTPRGYRDESPFEGAGSESGYFTPVGEGGGQERPVLERPVSGRFRENDDERSVGGR